MKKVFLTLALVCFGFMANAQFVVSGNLGFGCKNDKVVYDGTRQYLNGSLNGVDKTSTFGFNLMGAYQINDKIRAGVLIGAGFDKVTTEAGTLLDPTTVATTDVTKTKNYMFGIFGRYNCWTWSKLTVFAELPIAIASRTGYRENTVSNTTTTVDNPKMLGFQIAIVPGFSYQISKHVAADLYLDFIGLAFNSIKYTEQVNNKEYVERSTSFGLKIQNMDMSIASFNQAVRMGVSFTF